jgi:hypothetical protein
MTAPNLTPAQVVDAMHAAFRKGDLDGISRHWSDEVHYEAPGVELHGKAARIEAEKVWLGAFSENDVHTHTRFVDGDEVVDFAVMSGLHSGPLPLPGGATLPATARRVSGPYVSRYRVVEGRVIYQHVVYDRLALVEQLSTPA